MPNALVIGANRGIGLGLVRELRSRDWRVLATCRDPEQAEELRALAAEDPGNLAVHSLDVTDDAAIARLAEDLGNETLDLFVHNAGVYGPRARDLAEVDSEEWMQALRVNTVAPYQTARAFAEHVARADGGRMCFMSSKMGSIADNGSGGSYPYRSTKAGVNIVAKSLAVELEERGVCVVPLHPGWVRTDMGGDGAPLSVEDSCRGLVDVMEGLDASKSGRFWAFDGEEIPW